MGFNRNLVSSHGKLISFHEYLHANGIDISLPIRMLDGSDKLHFRGLFILRSSSRGNVRRKLRGFRDRENLKRREWNQKMITQKHI